MVDNRIAELYKNAKDVQEKFNAFAINMQNKYPKKVFMTLLGVDFKDFSVFENEYPKIMESFSDFYKVASDIAKSMLKSVNAEVKDFEYLLYLNDNALYLEKFTNVLYRERKDFKVFNRLKKPVKNYSHSLKNKSDIKKYYAKNKDKNFYEDMNNANDLIIKSVLSSKCYDNLMNKDKKI